MSDGKWDDSNSNHIFKWNPCSTSTHRITLFFKVWTNYRIFEKSPNIQGEIKINDKIELLMYVYWMRCIRIKISHRIFTRDEFIVCIRYVQEKPWSENVYSLSKWINHKLHQWPFSTQRYLKIGIISGG